MTIWYSGNSRGPTPETTPETLWRSLKYEDIYLREYRDLAQLEVGIGRWMGRYNRFRPHQSLGYDTPWEWYRPTAEEVA